jgi:hypothetical protein
MSGEIGGLGFTACDTVQPSCTQSASKYFNQYQFEMKPMTSRRCIEIFN